MKKEPLSAAKPITRIAIRNSATNRKIDAQCDPVNAGQAHS